jgi:hypothetical protein
MNTHYAEKHRFVPDCVIPQCEPPNDERMLVLVAGRPQWVCSEHQPKEG